MTAATDREAITDHRERSDSSEPTLRNEPTEPIEKADPTDPMDMKDPTDPIDRNEPFDQSERNELLPVRPLLSWHPMVRSYEYGGRHDVCRDGPRTRVDPGGDPVYFRAARAAS